MKSKSKIAFLILLGMTVSGAFSQPAQERRIPVDLKIKGLISNEIEIILVGNYAFLSRRQDRL
jgi:hypothetical protein